jgi:hypothetical protein
MAENDIAAGEVGVCSSPKIDDAYHRLSVFRRDRDRHPGDKLTVVLPVVQLRLVINQRSGLIRFFPRPTEVLSDRRGDQATDEYRCKQRFHKTSLKVSPLSSGPFVWLLATPHLNRFSESSPRNPPPQPSPELRDYRER